MGAGGSRRREGREEEGDLLKFCYLKLVFSAHHLYYIFIFAPLNNLELEQGSLLRIAQK